MAVEVRLTVDRGFGLFATRDIQAAEVSLLPSFPPPLSLDQPVNLSSDHAHVYDTSPVSQM
jgi:hypothetical protein